MRGRSEVRYCSVDVEVICIHDGSKGSELIDKLTIMTDTAAPASGSQRGEPPKVNISRLPLRATEEANGNGKLNST